MYIKMSLVYLHLNAIKFFINKSSIYEAYHIKFVKEV